MLPLSLKVAVLRDCSPLSPSCFSLGNRHYLPDGFSGIASVTPPHFSSGNLSLFLAPQRWKSLHIPLSPQGCALNLPQGSLPHPQNCPSRIAPLAAPSTMLLYPQNCPLGFAPHHLQGSLLHGSSLFSPSGITPSWPKLSLRD